jgi:uncharacterized protein YjiK
MIKITAVYISFSLLVFISCNNKVNFSSPPGYDLNHPIVVNLNSELNEISGITYYPKDTGIFAISDETGYLYKIFPNKKVPLQKWKFGSKHDYEDLQRIDSTFYILASNGDIVSIKFSKNAPMQVSNFKKNDKEKNEFETLYFDSTINKLVLICKDCKKDKKETVSTHAFDVTNNTYGNGPYTINVNTINKEANVKEMKFKPSAAAVNPITNELFIVSSVNKMLVIADKNGNAKSVYNLRPSIYKQPEGIAFTPKGDLIISNEFAKDGTANILVIKYKK